MKKKLINHSFKNIFIGLALALAITIIASLFADLIYQPKELLKRGYIPEITAIPPADQAGKAAGLTTGSKPAEPVVQADIKELIKNADLAAGEKTFKKCAVCHNIAQKAGNKIGPNLFGVVDRKRASMTGFAYSEAMKNKPGHWDIEELNQFLTSPKSYVPGTKMGFAGLKKDQDRANVIAYLKKMGQ